MAGISTSRRKAVDLGREWRVEATLTGAAEGVATVEIRVRNEVCGELTPWLFHVDWKAGMEPEDVSRQALLLAGGLMHSLAAELASMATEA